MNHLARFRKWLLMRGLRKHAKIDDCEAKALSEMDASHLRVIARVMRRLNRNSEVAIGDAVLPLLTRDIALPRHLAALSKQDLFKAAAELIGLHSTASAAAVRDGTIESFAKTLYDQIAKLLNAKLPYGCSLLLEVCIGELSRSLTKGWSPQLAGGIFIHRFLGNPKNYVIIRKTTTHSEHSSAPYSVSRSECRG